MLLTRQQVTTLSGLSEDDVAHCESAGLIVCTREAEAEGFRHVELTKLHIIRQVADAAGGVEEVVRAAQAGAFDLSLLETFLPDAGDLDERTLDQVLQGTPVTCDEVQAMLRAAGLPDAPADKPLTRDQVDVLRHVVQLVSLPMPPEAHYHTVRSTSEAVRRAAEVQVQVFRQYVEEPVLGACAAGDPIARNHIASIAQSAVPSVIALTHWMHRQHLQNAVLEAITNDMMEAVREGRGVRTRTGDPVVVFVDLVGFTPLVDGAGEHKAAQIAAGFEDVVIDTTRSRGGRIVKMLGDGALLLFADGDAAVRCGLDVVQAIHRAGLPRARVGIHRGPVVVHAGDVFGLTVNVAARINEYARPREVLISAAVAPDGIAGVELEEIGEVSLKGVVRPTVLLRAREHVPAER
ncbi:MAG TPA: adenylate/guanylate cyclase domain-containing protein [Candidatus Dormibacteraeota bacterium]|nr:adenylate/guanylate cyclase domain-containing protein [Candidatus Dormibacteraeota bacterium]